MLFNSIHFIIFLPIVVICYWLLPNKLRNVFLLVASYYFYMCWNAGYALLILFTTISTWGISLLINKVTEKTKKILLVIGLTVNLSILFTFKYYDFFMALVSDCLSRVDIDFQITPLGYVLPVGISFYTFQSLSYLIDVYRNDIKPEKNPIIYALFVSFFPQLVAGPIERASNLLPQFRTPKVFQYELFRNGLMLILWGFMLKLGLADRCALYVDAIYDNLEQHNGGSYLLASVLFAFQIYGDFCGYSLVAIGSGKMLGFNMMRNFKHPYLAASVSEFWKRWHISLSTWFKDYVYIPLGGSRCSQSRNMFNLMTTMLLSGLWHGASLSFVAWGGLHGILMCIERALGLNKNTGSGIVLWIRRILCFSIICLIWIFFRAENLSDAVMIVSHIFTDMGVPFIYWTHFFAIAFMLLIIVPQEILWDKGHSLAAITGNRFHEPVIYSCMIGMICYLLLFGVLNGDQFIYFQF